MRKLNHKGAVWISAVIYVMTAIVILVVVLEAGMPLIKGLSERSGFGKVKDSLVGIDKQIQQVSSEGQGSQRVVPLEINDGEFSIDDYRLRWKLETDSKLIEPKSRVELGNLIISSGIDVDARQEGNYFIVENSRIRVNYSKVGSKTNQSNYNTSSIINWIHFKDSNAKTTGQFTFFINDSTSISGLGYTELENTGTGLTSAILRAHINNSAMDYDLVLTLESEADFIRTSVENFVKK